MSLEQCKLHARLKLASGYLSIYINSLRPNDAYVRQ